MIQEDRKMPSVRYFAPDTDAYVDSVKRHAEEFTLLTGLDIEFHIIPTDKYFSNDIQAYLDGEERADVYMSGPVLLWDHIGSDSVEPLDPYLLNAEAGFDINDFFGTLIASNRWSGRFREPLGKGALWEIPVNCETYNLAYIPATLEKHGCPVPDTWDGYFATARQVQQGSRGATRGFAQRGTQVWHTMYTGYATQFWACGARDFDETGRCAIASREGIAATQAFVEALREAGPSGWLSQRWYELAMDFAAGRYGLIVDSDHYVAFYEMGDTSAVKGKVGYALPPVGPAGRRESNMWTWSLVMNSRSRNKKNAWRFIEWAAGKRFLLRSAFEGNMNPTRRSTWDDPGFRATAAGWGNFYPVTRRLIETEARVLVTPVAGYREIGERWVRALRTAFTGDQGVAEALESAAAEIDFMVSAGRS
jgi:multiple sugar transport system substrate-binding protein